MCFRELSLIHNLPLTGPQAPSHHAQAPGRQVSADCQAVEVEWHTQDGVRPLARLE